METVPLEARADDPVLALQEMLEQGAQIQGRRADIMDGPDGAYLSDILSDSALEISITHISENKTAQLGATDSHHGVKFAKVEYLDEENESVVVDVAIKYFEDTLESALFEYDSLLAVHEKGIDSLIPAALVRDGSSAYLVTLLRPDIHSLDNARWNVRPGESGFETICKNLEFIADSMALMHSNGIFHGDAQPKNFVRSDTGKHVAVDLEKGCLIVETGSQLHVDAFNREGDYENGSAIHDLRQFWVTLNRQIGLRPGNLFLGEEATPQEILATFEKHFVERYQGSLLDKCQAGGVAGLNIAEVVERLRETVFGDLGLARNNQ